MNVRDPATEPGRPRPGHRREDTPALLYRTLSGAFSRTLI